MSLGTSIYTWLCGHLVGEDVDNNKYYCNSKNYSDLNAKRWVIFKGEIEATKIPPHWHAWLHKSIDKPPLNYTHKYSWQKNHEQNSLLMLLFYTLNKTSPMENALNIF